MGNTANSAKTRWNAANYTQVKAYVAPDTASAFKAACADACVSMNRVLSQFMVEYCDVQASKKPVKETDFVSTNKKRRKKHEDLINQLVQLRDAQEYANDNVQENFRDTENYEAAEERVAKMDEAIEILKGVY